MALTGPTAAGHPGEERSGARLLAVDRLTVAYLAATGLIAGASLQPQGLLLAAGHSAAATFLYVAARRLSVPEGSAARFLRLFYPVLLTPLFYHEVSVLGQLLVDGYFDPRVQRWEEALFGVQPSVASSRWLPWTWLSELFHLGYLSYYLLVPGAALAVHLRGTARDLHRLAVSVAGAFFACYLIFSLFPVVGPRYLFQPLEGPAAQGPLHALTHWILEGGSSKGTAFPSSHVAAAVSAWLASRRAAPVWFRWSAPLVWLLVVGTVYGGFHYAVDALAGLAVAAVAWIGAPALCRAWAEPPGNPGGAEGIQRHG